jgi:hypothetical protein
MGVFMPEGYIGKILWINLDSMEINEEELNITY